MGLRDWIANSGSLLPAEVKQPSFLFIDIWVFSVSMLSRNRSALDSSDRISVDLDARSSREDQ